MSKLIKISPEVLAELRKDFEESLATLKISDGKFNFSKTFGTVSRKATLYFTEIAWHKMQALVREFDKEVAWHGIAKRGVDETKDEYIISDIIVYPQLVTGTTVNTDQAEYETWLMSHEDDVFNNIRMQGHSHVSMSTSPSSVDTTHQEKILEQLEDDMFYIFLIWNKRDERTIKIYDLSKNVLFETSDVTVMVIEDETGIEKFISSAKEMVKNKPAITTGQTAQTSVYTGAYSGVYEDGGYDWEEDYYKRYYGLGGGVSPENKNDKKDDKENKDTAKKSSIEFPTTTPGKKKHKGKRKDKKKSKHESWGIYQ